MEKYRKTVRATIRFAPAELKKIDGYCKKIKKSRNRVMIEATLEKIENENKT